MDTAYVRRGTGPIKPQYMLMVRPQTPESGVTCDPITGDIIATNGEFYRRGYYLINATDSAKNPMGEISNYDYIWDTKWERLVFTDAVHARDYLYIINGSPEFSSKKAIDLDALDAEALKKNTKIRKVYLGNNDHKDVVFSMRLIERGANDFIIESESTDRIFHYTPDTTKAGMTRAQKDFERFVYKNSEGAIIAPCEGGWIKLQNGTMVISRSDVIFNMPNSFRFNVKRTSDDPVANDAIASDPISVIGNDGSITILNAAGKKVVVNNILGQAVANTVIASDNATISVPKGIVVVAVEGQTPVKALVK